MKTLLVIIFIIINTFIVNAQDINKFNKSLEKVKIELKQLHPNSQNLFFNYGFVFQNDLEEWYLHKVIFATINKWLGIYNCINNSYTNNKKFGLYNDSIFRFYERQNAQNETNIGIIYFEGDYLPLSEQKEVIKLHKIPDFKKMVINSNICFKKSFYSNNIIFKYRKDLFFSNITKQNKVYINFGDNKGFREIINLENNQDFVVNYLTEGEKSIALKIISNKDTTISYSKIVIYFNQIDIKPTVKNTYISGNKINLIKQNSQLKDQMPPSSGTYGGPIISLNYRFYKGCDDVFDKPVIISEGFDILGNNSLSDMQMKWASVINSLTNKGYDVFLIDYNNPDKPITFNSTLVKNFICDIRNQKDSHFEGIYIGESMGGIIGRIALKELENEEYDHEFGLYVSWDSPHKGANIPVGIQYLVANFSALSPIIVSTSYAISTLEDALGIDIPYVDLFQMLNSEAAQQLLAQHYISPHIMYSTFQLYLENLKYPNNLRKIAFANGSNIATPQEGVIRGSKYINIHKSNNDHNWIHAWGYYFDMFAKYGVSNTTLNVANILGGFYDYVYWTGVFTGGGIELPYPYIYGNKVFDDAPGSNVNSTSNMIGFTYDSPKFTFVPTTSAIDLKKSIFNTGNFKYYNENGTHNTQYLIDNDEIPFDDIYADNYNNFHTAHENSTSNIIQQEIMPDNMYIQNREIEKDRDFEATESITAGKNISGVLSNSTHTKHINQGDVVIKNGATVNFTAGEAIDLKNGFTVENGADFTASIESVCGNNKSQNVATTYINPPEIIGSSKFCEETSYYTNCTNCDIEWRLRGGSVDIQNYGKTFTTPNNLKYGQYTLYCTKYTDKGVKTKSKVIHTKCIQNYENIDTILNKNISSTNITIYPNPTKGNLKITSLQNTISQITITNVSGITVFSQTG